MFVKGYGDPHARIVAVGEAPGRDEDLRGRPFVGLSGRDLHRYANAVGIDIPSEVFLTNLVRLRPPNNADPTLHEIERDEHHLTAELKRIKPEYVIGIGRFSTWWLMGRQLDERGRPVLPDMEMIHGIPHQITICFRCRRSYAQRRAQVQDGRRSHRCLRCQDAEPVLGVDRDQTVGRLRRHLLEDASSAGTSSDLRALSRADRRGLGPGSLVHQPKLRTSGSSESDITLGQHTQARDRAHDVREGARTDTGEYVCSCDDAQEWEDSGQGVPRVQKGAQAGALGSIQGQDQCCTSREKINCTLVGVYHPAFGLHSPDKQNDITEDWKVIAGVVRGDRPPHHIKDRYPNPRYVELRDGDGHINILAQQSAVPYHIAIDTEGSRANPWGLSFSVSEGSGYVVRVDQHETLMEVAEAVRQSHVTTILHGALHDLPVLAVMGVRPANFVCTMQMAYSLCLHPHALKPLSYRLCGIREVQSYEDVVGPAGHRLAMEYLRRVLEHECLTCRGGGEVVTRTKKGVKKGVGTAKCPECGGDGTTWPRPETVVVWENGQPKPYTPMSIGRRVRKIITDVESGKDTDPRDRCDEEIMKVVGPVLGPMPEPTLDHIPLETAVVYAAGDSDKTLRIFKPLKKECDDAGLWPVLEMDHAIIPMCVRMMDVGMGVDVPYFHQLTKTYRSEMREIENEIKDMVGKYVNPSSSKQVAALLFKDLGLPVIKLTKSKEGESTDDKVLETLKVRTNHPVIDHLIRYRELHKLVGTYTTTIPEKVGRDGRVHTRIRTTRTTSGRLSAFDPNLMNIPVRSDSGRQIRDGFVVLRTLIDTHGVKEAERLFPTLVNWYDAVMGTRYTSMGSWDLDQIEMRILAHESRDRRLVQLFNDGYECRVYKLEGKCKCHDIHLLTASLIYRKPIDQITSDERTLSKNVGFGIMYGLTARGLRDQMAVRGQNWTEEECQAMIDAYLEDAYPGVKEYMDRQSGFALANGYVVDMFGRRRYVRAVHSVSKPVSSEALRQSGNHGIQSGAQGVIKLAMRRLWENTLPVLWSRGYKVEPLMQIHDSLEMEFELGLEDLLNPLITRVFREVGEEIGLRVPIGGKGAWAGRWSELKD